MRLMMALALVVATTTPLLADGQEVNEGIHNVDLSDIAKSLRQCPGIPQVAQNLCAQEHALAAASEFQAVSGGVRAALDPQMRPAFDDAQTAFVAFVKASCQFDAARFKGGSAAMWLFESCVARRYAARARSLTAYAQYPDRDVAGLTLTDFDLGDPE
ncbi:lysozyme inhibitor LprI family protein [Dongia deserti]|uniref:lysozyme inhibitor LprI family protein n=1 Tax=Dongia deserti TaxID=2268030 RepID=UPI000E646D8D|nr:lysozyme inhibitor LprI family protein [Dongia deserti]